MSITKKSIRKIKDIYRKSRKVKYNGKFVTIKYKREKVKVYKCKHCDFKHLNLEKNGKYLKAHLTRIHKVYFIKGHSQQVKIQNAIILLSNFNEIENKELLWVCPYCEKRFIHFILHGDFKGKDYLGEHKQIIYHLNSCPKNPKKLKI